MQAPPAPDAAVSTLAVPGLGSPSGLFVVADGSWLVSTAEHTLQLLTPSGWRTLIAGANEEGRFEDGEGAAARFNCPAGITVDPDGHAIVADFYNNALRRVSKAGAVSTLAGGVLLAVLHAPHSVVFLPDSGEFVVSSYNALRVVTPGGAVRTLAGSEEGMSSSGS